MVNMYRSGKAGVTVHLRKFFNLMADERRNQMNKQDENALTEAWHSDTNCLNRKIDEFFKVAQDHAYALGLARGLAESKSAPSVEWFVQWIRNNYQNHPNIASLCDAMREAAHGIAKE